MNAFRRRISKATFLTVLLVVASAWLVGPPAQEVRAADSSVRFGPIPVRGDCRTVVKAPGQECTWDAWTGEVTVSPKIVREGETLSVNVSIFAGAISYRLEQIADCKDRTETRPVEVKGADGKWFLQDQPVRVESNCTWKPVSTGGRWGQVSAGITGPCGSFIAVQEGRAEFAACGSATDSDYYGVIPKEEELWAISGRVAGADHRRLAGVLVELSGTERQSAVTSASGDYAFLVKKGSYSVTTDAGFCASVDGSSASGCPKSGSVSVPGSHAVDFRPEKEGVIKGTVFDAKGKGLRGATVSAVGKNGQTVVTDTSGAYTMTLIAGPYQVTAFGDWKAADDAQGKPMLIRPVYCTSQTGECVHRLASEVKGSDEQILNWHDRGFTANPAEELTPVIDPTVDPNNPANLDLWFLVSVIAIGGAGVAGAGAAAGGDEDGSGGEGGGSGGSGGGPDKPWSDMSEEEKQQFRSWFIERWKQAYPNHTPQQLLDMIAVLDDQPDSFWERTVQASKDLELPYPDGVGLGDPSGSQGGLDGFIDQLLYLAKRDVADPLSVLAAIGGAPDEVLLSKDSKALKQWAESGGAKDLYDEFAGDPAAFAEKYGISDFLIRDMPEGNLDPPVIGDTDMARYKALYEEFKVAEATGDDYNANRLKGMLLITTLWIGGQLPGMEIALEGATTKLTTKTVGGLEEVVTGQLDEVSGLLSYKHIPEDMVLDPEQLHFLGRDLESIEDIVDSNGNPINTKNTTQRLTFSDGSKAIVKPESGVGENISDGVGPKYSREVGTYVVDRALGFDQVPTTAVIDHPDLGLSSIQSWEAGTDVTSAGAFSETEQQMAAVRDYITGEADRHLGNVIQAPDGSMICIDGGESFPPGGGTAAFRSEFVFNAIDQDLDPAVLAAVKNVDRAALTESLLDTGLTQQQVDGAMSRLDSIATEGKLTLSGLGSSGQMVTVFPDDFSRGIQQVQLP